MNKSELIEAVAKASGLSKADSDRALGAITDTISKSLKKGNPVALVGFGTFKVSKRNARMGRNPQTGASIKIAARTVPRFTAGKALKDAVAKK
ncbi:MAG: HU family DNA-binding protein [Ignavibacteriota bacterium]